MENKYTDSWLVLCCPYIKFRRSVTSEKKIVNWVRNWAILQQKIPRLLGNWRSWDHKTSVWKKKYLRWRRPLIR